MKVVLKTISSKDNLDYDKPFNSEKNAALRRRLILELRKFLAPNFQPSVDQLTNWLKPSINHVRQLKELRKVERALRSCNEFIIINEYMK